MRLTLIDGDEEELYGKEPFATTRKNYGARAWPAFIRSGLHRCLRTIPKYAATPTKDQACSEPIHAVKELANR